MPYKVNHYARPVDIGFSVSWESIAIELFIGIICCVMGYTGWVTGMALMAVPCAFVAIICFGLVIFQVFMYFKEKLRRKNAKEEPDEQKSASN